MSRQHSGHGALAPLIATTMIAALASPSFAQPDHLHCYKVNDSAAKAKYVADLDALTAAPGCEISVPAKMFCVESTKSNVTPPPPGGGPSGTPAGLFACYKLKCPKATIADESVVDQFGEHTFTKMKSKFVCAPAVSAAPTTTTTSPTLPGTTTTLPTSLPELVISEFLADPQAQSDTGGEYIEIYNAGADPVNLQGLTLSNGSTASNIPDPLVLAPNDYAVFGRSNNAAGGAVDGTFSFGLPNTAGTIQIKSSDVVIDELSYSSTTPGTAEEVGTAFLTAAGNDPEENRCLATAMIAGGDFGTPGAAASCTP